MNRKTAAQRLIEKVGVLDPSITECVHWPDHLNNEGYGKIHNFDGSDKAHRVAYEHFIGPVPDGLKLDHLCRQRDCVNPWHLEPVTDRENILRGEGVTAQKARQTHCIHGHEFTSENTYIDRRGRRNCRACDRIKKQRRKASQV